MATRTFVTATTLMALGLVVATAVAITSLRGISVSPTVDIAVSPSAWQIDEGRVAGRVGEGLPTYRLHWDGQPPSAVLMDARRGAVLAAAVFTDQGFSRSRNAVRFVDGDVRFVLDTRRLPSGNASLAVRVEVVPPRGRFTAAATLAVCFALALPALVAFRRYETSPLSERPARLRRLAESAVFVAIALGVFFALYPGAPVRVAEVTDEANINSYAAASDHPERFVLDKLLSDPSHFRWYAPAYINLIRSAKTAGFHYATAEAFLVGVIALFLLFGLRRLFTAVSGSPAFGVAAALGLGLMSAPDVPPPGEVWSILSALPRMLFTALLPWALLLALRCAPSARRWWIACGAAGLLVHLYPLSAPALVGSLLVAFVVASDEPWPSRARGAALGVAAAVAAMLPFVIIYTTRYQQTVDVDPAMAARSMQIASGFYADNSPARVLRQLVAYRVGSFRVCLDALALVLLCRRRFDTAMRFYVGLLVGFALVTFAVPIADDAVASYLGRRPYELELMRSIRFMDMFLVGALALAVRGWRGSRRTGLMVVGVASVCAIVALGSGWFDTVRAIAARSRLSWRILNGRSDRESNAAQEAIRAVSALRASDERVMGPVGLRQFDIPLACGWKDVGVLAYSAAGALIECADEVARGLPLLRRPVTERSLDELSSVYSAQLLLLRRADLDDSLARSAQVLFENEVYAIVRARPEASPRASPSSSR
jgi:hypothetical protein